MQPLPTTRRMMVWLSMCPSDQTTSRRQKINYIAYTLTILFVNLLSFLASLTFMTKFFSTDFDDVVFSCMTMTGEFGMIYIMIAAILMQNQIVEIFQNLSKIYKSSKLRQDNLAINHFSLSTECFSMKPSKQMKRTFAHTNF